MKKILPLVLVLSLFTISFISAIGFDMKDNFDREEILTAKLYGDFISPPLTENIFFYRGHVRIGVAPYIAKIGDSYYLYAALAGKNPGNYSIVIEDVEYTKGSQTVREDLTKEFTIGDSYTDFTISKGFVITKSDFYVELENLKDTDLDVVLSIKTIFGEEGGITSYNENEDYILTLRPGKKRVDFKLDLIKDPSTKILEFSSNTLNYSIPVLIFVDEFSDQNKFFAFSLDPKEIDLTMNLTSDRLKLIYIYNTGTGTLTDIKLRLSDSLKPYVKISEDDFGRILPNDNAHLNMTLLSSGEDGKIVSGDLFIETDEGLANSIRIIIRTEKGYVPSEEELVQELATDQTCEDTGGRVCTANEECDSKTFKTKNSGVCCPGGNCKAKISAKINWKVVGGIVLIVIILGGVWFLLKKYKKIGNPIDLLKIAGRKK